MLIINTLKSLQLIRRYKKNFIKNQILFFNELEIELNKHKLNLSEQDMREKLNKQYKSNTKLDLSECTGCSTCPIARKSK
ncbi:MAG: hypothetical protein LBD36_00285 [Holosporales bacterium]|jgi:predicted aldo/keto reductase-like oxidoreductase|nr:hypothetical protein [Holosporales bacterium]